MRVDYRRLNSLSKADAYPMPRVDNLIDQLGDTKFITPPPPPPIYLRLLAGSFERRGEVKNSFYNTLWVIPFGLQEPQLHSNDVLLDDTGDYASAYLDDELIYSKSWDDHLTHVRDVLQRLQHIPNMKPVSL